MFNLIHNLTVIKIDFIVRKESDFQKTAFKRKRLIDVEGIKMWLISPEDLILSKLLWARDSMSEMQLRDVKHVIVAVKNLDYAYIEHWILALGLENIYNRVKV